MSQTLWTLPLLLWANGLGCRSSEPAGKDNGESGADTSVSADTEPQTDSATAEGLVISPALILEKELHPTNVLLVTTDTLRTNRLNSYGYQKRITTPNIDALLAAGVNLTHQTSCSSWTYPAFICAFTGTDQVSAGHWPLPWIGDVPQAFPGTFPSFVADLNNRGFQTAMVTGNQVLRAFGLEAGFDVHVKCPRPECPVGEEGVAAATTNKAIELFEAFDRDQPWLLQVHYFEPHLPNDPPERYLPDLPTMPSCSLPFSTYDEQVALLNAIEGMEEGPDRTNCLELAEYYYDAEVRFMDDEIGRLLAYAETQGLWEDTLLIYFSDHGEELYDHGFWGHGTNNFHEQISGTAAFYQPGNLTPYTVTGATTLEDIAPTAYALLGLEPFHAFTGTVVDNASDRITYQMTYRYEETQHSVTSTTDKLVYTADCSPMQYYDLTADPGETQNLYDPTNPRVIALWEELEPRILQLAIADDEYSPCGYEDW